MSDTILGIGAFALCVVFWIGLIRLIKAAAKVDAKMNDKLYKYDNFCCSCGQPTTGTVCAHCGSETLYSKQDKIQKAYDKLNKRLRWGWIISVVGLIVRYLQLNNEVKSDGWGVLVGIATELSSDIKEEYQEYLVSYLTTQDTYGKFFVYLFLITIAVGFIAAVVNIIKQRVVRRAHITGVKKLLKQ